MTENDGEGRYGTENGDWFGPTEERYGEAYVLLSRDKHGSDTWKAIRQNGITATDARAIMGVDPYGKTGFTVYWSKNETLDEPVSARMQRGSDWEAFASSMVWAKGGDRYEGIWDDSKLPGLMARWDASWQLASCDMIVHEKDAGWVPIEIKLVAKWGDEWGPDGTDQVPLGFKTQLMWQMQVIGAPHGYLAAIMPDHAVYLYRIELDEADHALMVGECRTFWNRYIIGEEIPPIVGTEAEIRVLKQVSRPTEGVVTPVPTDLVNQLKHLRATARDYERLAKEQEAKLRALLGDAEAGVDENGEVIITRSRGIRKGFTTEDTTVDTIRIKERKAK